MRRLFFILALLAWLPAPATGEEVVAGLSQTRVSITTSFTGSEIFVFGAVKREAPAPEGKLDVIIAVSGPSHPLMVRKKERRFGVWVNGPGVQIDAAPSFYAVKTTGPFREIISWTEELRRRVGLAEVIRLIDAPAWLSGERNDYLEAVVRVKENQGFYFVDEGSVSLVEDTLFETSIKLPANLVEGDYKARIMLLRDLDVVDEHITTIPVRKVGMERLLHSMAMELPAVYGVASVVLALLSGWIASALFRFFVP